MEDDLLTSFCRPLESGVWAKKLPSGFGAFTPCLVDSAIINLTCIVLLVFAIQRIRALFYGVSLERFKVSNPWRHGPALLLALFCAVAPLTQIALGISTVNLDGESSMPPFEVLSIVRSLLRTLYGGNVFVCKRFLLFRQLMVDCNFCRSQHFY